jgi:hypothetical protein
MSYVKRVNANYKLEYNLWVMKNKVHARERLVYYLLSRCEKCIMAKIEVVSFVIESNR